MSANCRDAFDAVYGSSAGAMNLTYFLAGQREGTDIYHEDIANERFCNMRRLLHRQEGRGSCPFVAASAAKRVRRCP